MFKYLIILLLICDNINFTGKIPEPLLKQPPAYAVDTQIYFTPPDSLYIYCHGNGRNYYSFPDVFVEPGRRYELSFYYMIARGSENDLGLFVEQYHDTDTSWKSLPHASFKQILIPSKRGWRKYSRVIVADKEANKLAITFKFISTDDWSEIGEGWMDNIQLKRVSR